MDISKELGKLFNLGQTYWAQADSEYASQRKKSNTTLEESLTLIAEIRRQFVEVTAEREKAVEDFATFLAKKSPHGMSGGDVFAAVKEFNNSKTLEVNHES